MTNKEEAVLIEEVMERAFNKMHSPDIISELSKPDVTDYERGKIAGQIEMMFWIAGELNPTQHTDDDEEEEDEDYLAGQKLD